MLPAPIEETAEDLYENAPCGYLSALPDGTIVRVNATLLDWTGYTATELVGRPFADLLTAGGRIYHETHYAPLLRMQGAVREIALELRCADGRRLPVLLNSTLRTADDGAPVMIRTTVFDATDRRRYEAELLHARQEAERSEGRARLLAQTLQASLIPPAPPSIPGLDVAAVYRPAGDGTLVGGDFYDVFSTARDDWAIVLGDVCGKGADAARVTALARYTVSATAIRTRRPSLVLRTLNTALLQHDTERFCTAAYARLRIGAGRPARITVASAGHPLPLRVTAAGEVDELGKPGDLLGVMDEPRLQDTTAELRPGDVLVFYSDGVPEARQGSAFYDEEALRDVVSRTRTQSADTIATAILDDVMVFQAGLARDDIAVVVLKVPIPAEGATAR